MPEFRGYVALPEEPLDGAALGKGDGESIPPRPGGTSRAAHGPSKVSRGVGQM
jgi:hypothetical protein